MNKIDAIVFVGAGQIDQDCCLLSPSKNNGSQTIPPSPQVQDSENIPRKKGIASSTIVEQYFMLAPREKQKEEEYAVINWNDSNNESEEAHVQNFDLAAHRRRISLDLPIIPAQDSKLMALTQFPSTTESVKLSTVESNGDIIDNPAGKLNTDAVPSITLSDTPASPWMLNY